MHLPSTTPQTPRASITFDWEEHATTFDWEEHATTFDWEEHVFLRVLGIIDGDGLDSLRNILFGAWYNDITKEQR
jgi:hypothetical protein